MAWIPLLAALLYLLETLLTWLKPATTANLTLKEQQKLAHVAGKCLRVASESSRICVTPQIDPAQEVDHTQ